MLHTMSLFRLMTALLLRNCHNNCTELRISCWSIVWLLDWLTGWLTGRMFDWLDLICQRNIDCSSAQMHISTKTDDLIICHYFSGLLSFTLKILNFILKIVGGKNHQCMQVDNIKQHWNNLTRKTATIKTLTRIGLAHSRARSPLSLVIHSFIGTVSSDLVNQKMWVGCVVGHLCDNCNVRRVVRTDWFNLLPVRSF